MQEQPQHCLIFFLFLSNHFSFLHVVLPWGAVRVDCVFQSVSEVILRRSDCVVSWCGWHGMWVNQSASNFVSTLSNWLVRCAGSVCWCLDGREHLKVSSLAVHGWLVFCHIVFNGASLCISGCIFIVCSCIIISEWTLEMWFTVVNCEVLLLSIFCFYKLWLSQDRLITYNFTKYHWVQVLKFGGSFPSLTERKTMWVMGWQL